MFQLIKVIKDLFTNDLEDEPEPTIMSVCPKCGSVDIKYNTAITNFNEALNGAETQYKTTARCLNCDYLEEVNCSFVKIPKFRS